MAALVVLVEALPRLASDGSTVPVLLAGGGADHPYFYDGKHWRAGIKNIPTLAATLGLKNNEFSEGAVPTVAALEWAGSNADAAALGELVWASAAVTIRIGPEGAGLPPIAMQGKVTSAIPADGVLTITLADGAAELKKPLLTERYLGTGGLEGPAEWEGAIRERIWGRVFNRPGRLIDPPNNIYAFSDPRRPIQSIDTVRDRGMPTLTLTPLGWQGSAEATFAALQAAAAPVGGGVACPSIACVKWWTQPAGELMANLRGEIGSGYVERPADIAARLVEAVGGPPFIAGTIAAANAARPMSAGWSATDESTTVDVMLNELLGSVSLAWMLDTLGQIVIRPWVWSEPAASVTAYDVRRVEELRPVSTRKLGYQRNESPMARGDLAAMVLATEVAYLDGTPIENLKPQEPGATHGAPAGTPVAGIPAETLVGQFATFMQELIELNEDTEQAAADLAAAQAQIGAMQSQVTALQGSVTTAQSSILAMQGDILANATSLATVTSTVASQGAAITTLQTTATSLQGDLASLTTTVAAGGSTANLLLNPDFTQWPNATGAPTSWSSTSALSRVAGRPPKPYAARLVGGAGVNSVYTQQYTPVDSVRPEQWIMLEAEVTLDAGTLIGSGLLVYTNDNSAGNGVVVQTAGLMLRFAVDPDATGTVVGNGVVGRRYTFSRLVRLSNDPNHSRLRVMASAHVSSLGVITDANAVIFHRIGARPATAAEIEGRATSALVTTQATAISTLQGSVASLTTTVSTQGSSISTLLTASSTQAGQIAAINTSLTTANASIAANASAITGLDSSVATLETSVSSLGAEVGTYSSAITTLQGQVATLNTTVGTQGASITSMQSALTAASGSIATLQTQVRTGGGNLLTNVEFAGSRDGWSAGWAPGTEAHINGAGEPWKIPTENNFSFYQDNANQNDSAYFYQEFTAEAGKWYEISAWIAAHRCQANLYTEFFNAAGTQLVGGAGTGYVNVGNGGQDIASWSRLVAKGPAPAGTTRGRFVWQKPPTSAGQANSWQWMMRPQVVEVTQTEASPAPFSYGNSRATVTTMQASVNGLFAKWGVELNVNGYITGITLNNNGTRADLWLDVDHLAVGRAGSTLVAPFQVVGGVTYIRNALIQNAAIDTLKVAGAAITANQVAGSPDLLIPAFTELVFFETGWMTIGDGVFGSATVDVSCSIDAGDFYDSSVRMSLFIDTGGGYVLHRQPSFGVATDSGDTRWRLFASLRTIVNAAAIRVRADCWSGVFMPAATARAIYVRDIIMTVSGAKR